MYTKEIYSVDGGFGYRILNNSTPIIVQDIDPEVSGIVVMDEARANAAADTVLARLNAPQE